MADRQHFPSAITEAVSSNTACPDTGPKAETTNIFLLLQKNITIESSKYVFSSIVEYILILTLMFAFSAIFYVIYKSYISPVFYKKELTEVGFDHIPQGPDRGRRISRAQASRRMGSKLPPPYPNGWFAVAETRELKVGSVLSIDALGQNLCVYRGEDGLARCVDAYCPHLGANLAVGGTVRGSCIECPFHKWRFNAAGTCVSLPGSDIAPKGVSIRTWCVVETDGAVWIWHDAEGREPLWEITDPPELKEFGYRGRNEFEVSAHIQEIPENGADVPHLNAVHSSSLLSDLGERYPVLHEIIGRHVWNADWTKSDDHTSLMHITQEYKVLKYDLARIDVKVTQIGPGHVRLFLKTSVGPFYIAQSVTPLGPLLQKVIHRVYSPAYNAPVGAFLVRCEAYMFERDVTIWNSKRFVSAPAYVKTDKTIRTFRNWFGQFYSEHSLSFRDALQNPLDW
ncbi:cholesterol 7-desaturase [Bombyx mandarina]|uniref:cholesterol 7-desaturase n=1 Tax=Bombyx mandarina TaxID=7092 RepID=A0A6J2KGW8_BOMMA|nr:cholesterol 7-desaturase [Bombyx mandarina]